MGRAGSTAGKLNAAAGVQTVNLLAGTPLVAGTVCYAAFACSTIGTTAAQLVMVSFPGVTGRITDQMGTSFGTRIAGFKTAGFPLAAPGSFTGNAASVPVLGL